MATQKLAKVVITANAATAKKVLEEIDALVEKYTVDIQKMAAAGQANTAECKRAESTLKALSQVQRDNIEDTKRLGQVVQDLTKTKLRDLRRAFGSGKSALAKLTGSDADLKKAEQIRAEMKQVGNEIRLIEGQYVKIAEGLKNVQNQSDQWLDKALKQQRDLVGSLQKSDAGYQQNLATLKQLEAEEDRRKGKMSKLDAFKTVNNEDASASDLRRAKATLIEARDNTPTKYSDSIGDYNREIQEIEKRLEAVSGKAQKAAMSWKEMRQVLAAPNKASGEDIKRTMEVIQQKIQQLPAGSKYVADLRRQYSMLEQTLKGTRMSQSALNDILRRSKSGKASLDELRRAYKQLEEELNQINTKSKEFADKQKAMKDLKKNIDEATDAAKKQGGAWQTALKNLVAYVVEFGVFNKVKEIMTGVIKKNLDYSGSLTDIRKISGLTMKEVNQLSTELAKIDTRTSVEGLAKLAYEGSKLGMSKYGVEGLASFVRAADKINVAIGEEMGEEALPALSKMVEVMGLIPKMGIEKAMLATGSAMFKLSTTSTSTSNDIVEFAKRLTGVARTAGITTDQLLALGSASSSMMLMPEVASTAMGKFIVALQKNHNLIAQELGIPDETIKNLYASGHAMDAIVLVLEKMKQKGNMNALGEIFKDLGSDGQRLVTAMVTMSKNVDMLKDHLYESQKAFSEATAVTSEYQMQQQSAIGILERANNLWEKAFVNPNGVESVKMLSQAWYDMSVIMTQSPIFKGTLNTALSLLITSAKALVVLLPAIVNYLVVMGVWKTVAFFAELAKAIWAAVTAQNALNASAKVNPYVALAATIMTVIGVVSSYVNQANEAAKAAKEAERQANAWKNTLGKAAVETANLNKKLANYKRMMNESNLTQAERQRLISRFNKDFRSYISNLGIEIKNVKDLRDHYSELAQEVQRATYYRMREEAKQQALPKYDSDRLAASNALMAQVRKLGIDKLGVSFNDIDRWVSKGASGTAVFWYLTRMMDPKKSGLTKGFNWQLDKNGFVYRQNYDGSKIGPSSDDPQMQFELQKLLSTARWYTNSTHRRSKKEKEIDDAYKNFVHEGYTPYPEETPGTLENDAPVKGHGTGGHTGHTGHTDNHDSDEKNVAKDRANALIANIKAFYEEQMRKYLEWVAQMNADGEKISEGQQKEQMDYLQSQMNKALGAASQSIATLDSGWQEFYQHMDEDVMVYDEETSKQLLESIGKSDIKELHDLFTKLSGDLSRENNRTLAENLGALLDQIFANGSKELREAAEKLLARQREIQNILNEHDYTGAVNRKTRSDFDRIGFLHPANDVNVDTPEGLTKMNAAFDKLTAKARESITELYKLNPESKDFQKQFLQFVSVANEGFDFSKLKVQDLKAMYLELIKYSEEYTAAEKKQYDEAKMITDFLWKRNKRNFDHQDKLRKMENESKMFGKRTNFLSNLGLADLTADPEIELMKARMQAAEDYYAFVRVNMKNQQLIDEAERARQETELAYANQMATAMKNRLSQMKDLVQPIEDFGAAVGQAFAEMRYDAESANDAIRSALKSMLESWAKMALNDVNTQMWKAINDAGVKRGQKNAQPGIDAARANADANATIYMDWRNLGTADNPMWVRIVDGQYIDSNGNNLANNEPPAAWKKRHPEGTIHDYNKEAYGIDTANQTGAAAADAITGNGSLTDAVAGIGGSLIGDVMNMNFKTGKGGKSKEDKEKAKQLKKEKKHQKELSQEVKKGNKEREKTTSQGVKNITTTTEQGNNEQSKGTEVAQKTMMNATDAALNATLTTKQKNNDETLKSDARRTEGEVTFSIAGAMAKCFEFLGPIAGPIAAAVVMSTLMGLLQWALNSALGGGKKKNTSSTKNTKIVSGMLTYDSGNVQDLRPFVGNDGSLYWATEDNKPHDGVSLLTQPTATTINGQPSLVAENGPELVIGRETTQAMMMNNPQLLKALVNYDRNYSGRRAYDAGNVSETAANVAPGASATDEVVNNNTATNAALLGAINALLSRLDKPINAEINMYGRGGLHDSMTKANQFMKNKK